MTTTPEMSLDVYDGSHNARAARDHDNDSEVVARCLQWLVLCTRHMHTAKTSLLDPRCPVGEAKPRQNTRDSLLSLFGTAEGRETMTTTLETTLDVYNGSHYARATCT